MDRLKSSRTLEIAVAVVLTALAIVLVLLRAGDATEQASPKLAITTSWARPATTPGGTSAAYLTIINKGTAGDRLLAATSPAAGEVEIHTNENDGGVMRMRHLPDGVELPAGEEVAFAPGGLHLMLIGLKAPIAKGESFPLELKFRDAGSVTVQVDVATQPPPGAAK